MTAPKPIHPRVKTASAGAAVAVLLTYFIGLPEAVSGAIVVLLTAAAGWLPDAD